MSEIKQSDIPLFDQLDADVLSRGRGRIAAGWNPLNLTAERVGVDHRLLELGESREGSEYFYGGDSEDRWIPAIFNESREKVMDHSFTCHRVPVTGRAVMTAGPDGEPQYEINPSDERQTWTRLEDRP